MVFVHLIKKKNSHDGNILFRVETVELGIMGKDEERIVFHPPLQVTTEALTEKKISQKAVGVVILSQAGTMWAVLQVNENFSARECVCVW